MYMVSLAELEAIWSSNGKEKNNREGNRERRTEIGNNLLIHLSVQPLPFIPLTNALLSKPVTGTTPTKPNFLTNF